MTMNRKDIAQLSGNKSGATAIEYALIAALIALAALGAMQLVGSANLANFNIASSKLSSASQ